MFFSYTRRRHPKIVIISYSTYPIKLNIFQLILSIVISALKGWLILKKREKKERGQKSQYKRKERQPSFFRLGSYVIPNAIVELDIHHLLSPLIVTIILIFHFIHCTHMHI